MRSFSKYAALMLAALASTGCPFQSNYTPSGGTQDFKCYKICRDGNGNVVGSFNGDFTAASKDDAVEAMDVSVDCPANTASAQVSCQPQ